MKISQSLYFDRRVVAAVAAVVVADNASRMRPDFARGPCVAFCEPLLLLKIISAKREKPETGLEWLTLRIGHRQRGYENVTTSFPE
jgi:hypothetical protein